MSSTLSIKKSDTPAAAETPAVKRGFVRAAKGEMRHLFTNEVFNDTPKKVDLDAFVMAQVEAGKLVIGEPD